MRRRQQPIKVHRLSPSTYQMEPPSKRKQQIPPPTQIEQRPKMVNFSIKNEQKEEASGNCSYSPKINPLKMSGLIGLPKTPSQAPLFQLPVLPKPPGIHQLKDYGSLRRIGKGQFAEVLSGTDPESGQPVALKKIKLNGLDEKTLGLMYTEVKNLGAFDHPNIVKLHCWFEHTELKKLAWADPTSVRYLVACQTVGNAAFLDESLIWHLFAGMCAGVSYMHARDYIHRDLKPANILLSYCLRTVKLADFGLSRTASRSETITTFTGTRYYMAPERIVCREYGKPSDIWSLGCILYELTTLRSPFSGEHVNLDSLQEKVYAGRYPPIPEDAYSGHLHRLVTMCLALQPIRRPFAGPLAEAARFMNKKLSWLTSPEATQFWQRQTEQQQSMNY